MFLDRWADMDELDDPVGHSLRGRHSALARRAGNALTYQVGVATFAAVPADPDQADWDDLARLLGHGELADLFSADVEAPADWAPVFELAGFQMVLDQPLHASGPVEVLDSGDVPDMTALVEATRPGPFWPRTVELGAFYGVRENGVLIAMTGERLQPSGWTEISTVCTAPQARGRGLAARVASAAAERILARGERPFLHVAASNTGAMRLYERLGFTVRRQVRFHGYRVP